ncbi:MAG: ETC complex I subunit [Phenylobacterium sp.]|uniref:NADH dehydrogenase ubiquinone Fe-S protein 4 n=1 Tax=Phenylobacterium sp. TaxID=1871053 RepID=UPI001A1E080F|nr:NADH dehydrogenase ubiquinone Fe-S protein 4 [Phenylobacterium sp.]MBJ7409450.1 ETC complex I subunit [Phenylobacterium sp.]
MFDATDLKESASTPSVAARRHASALPDDAVALIRPKGPSVTSAGRATAKGWTLSFRPRRAPRIEPLMGWTETTDTLQQVQMTFPTAEAAIRYCQRQGLAFEVQGGAGEASYGEGKGAERPLRADNENGLQRPPGQLTAAEADRLYLSPEAVYQTPDAVLADAALSPEQKRSILRSWEWDEYLLEVEAGEAPVREHVSRLAEVRSALARLDAREASQGPDCYRWEPPRAA